MTALFQFQSCHNLRLWDVQSPFPPSSSHPLCLTELSFHPVELLSQNWPSRLLRLGWQPLVHSHCPLLRSLLQHCLLSDQFGLTVPLPGLPSYCLCESTLFGLCLYFCLLAAPPQEVDSAQGWGRRRRLTCTTSLQAPQYFWPLPAAPHEVDSARGWGRRRRRTCTTSLQAPQCSRSLPAPSQEVDTAQGWGRRRRRTCTTSLQAPQFFYRCLRHHRRWTPLKAGAAAAVRPAQPISYTLTTLDDCWHQHSAAPL